MIKVISVPLGGGGVSYVLLRGGYWGVHNGASPLSSHAFLMCSPNWLGDELGELLPLIAGIIASAWGVSWEQGLLAVDAAAS